MEEPVQYLILLLLQFDGTLVKEVIEFVRPTTLWECLQYADQHRETISTHKWVEQNVIQSGWYLNDGSGTWQGVICTNTN
jgi:hypothetical protein